MTTAAMKYTTPPVEVLEYEFSWSRSTGRMRFRLYEEGEMVGEWLCHSFVGQWRFLGTDRKSGNMRVECYLKVVDETNGVRKAYCYLVDSDIPQITHSDAVNTTPAHDHSQCQIATKDPFPQGRDTHWRLCYARELAQNAAPEVACWRLRDERTGQLWFVHDYEGDVNINYMDGGSHVFVDGAAFVDERGVAVFGDDANIIVESDE